MWGIYIWAALILIICACIFPWWFIPLLIVGNIIAMICDWGIGPFKSKKTEKRWTVGFWIVVGAIFLSVIVAAICLNYSKEIDRFAKHIGYQWSILSLPEEEVYVGDGKAPYGTKTETWEDALEKKENNNMMIILMVIIGVLSCVTIVMFKGRHKKREEEETDKRSERAREQDRENERKAQNYKQTQFRDAAGRSRNFSYFADTNTIREATPEEDELNYLRALQAERDAYDDFIASMDMADD